MSPSTIAILLVLLVSLWSFIHLRINSRRKNDPKLPPGPLPLPIIGNLHMLGSLPHRSLQELAKKYGPIMSIRLGNVPTIVVSSPRATELFLKTHDKVFASRPKAQVFEYMAYGTMGMSFTKYGPYWRNVRKFCTLELLSATKIDLFAAMRRLEMGLLVQSLEEAAERHEVVNVTEKVEEVIENMTYKMVFGRSTDDRFDLRKAIQETMVLAGTFNIADYVPFLGPLDLQGITRRLKALRKTIDKILDIIIDEHEEDDHCRDHNNNPHGDFVDVMLSLMNKTSSTHDDEFSQSIDRTNIKAIVIDMLAGAIDTSTTAILWTLSELLRHPRVMKQLQQEMKNIIGDQYKMVEEKDLAKLDYLNMVVKESLRLHPVAPLLVPHESMEDIVIDGYYIPNKSRIIINYWALSQDPNQWSENVQEFFPERFIGSNIEFRGGSDFQYVPFGSGRRGCPGMALGLINVRLVVAQLVHCFNWELPNGMSPNSLDMTEIFGLSLPKAQHLLAIPTYRLH